MVPIKFYPAPTSSKSSEDTALTHSLQSIIEKDVSFYLRPGILSLPHLPPLTLYIHIPWCLRKCPYCDFNSHAIERLPDQTIPEQIYLSALRSDLEASLPLIWGRQISSIFIGGGTPSLLSAYAVDQLLSILRTLLPLSPTIEITLEANPGTFEVEKFQAYQEAGINRLSIGIQSFNQKHLQTIGRIHGTHQSQYAVQMAAKIFENFNLDLMYALPHQSFRQLKQDIEMALSFAPPHLSLYQLSIEPNTLFHRYPPVLPNEDQAAEMMEWINCTMSEAGYQHYEVSAYARHNAHCQHNLNYWQFGDYLGIGAGAHSKLSFPHRILRQVRYKQPSMYIEQANQGQAIQEQHEVGIAELPFEFMLNAMRLQQGVLAHLFSERTGIALNQIETQLDEAERKGLLYRDHLTIRPTELGWRFLSDLQALFLTSEP